VESSLYQWTKVDDELQRQAKIEGLEREIERLRRENEMLQQMMLQHAQECP
jgi:hypothetical protein